MHTNDIRQGGADTLNIDDKTLLESMLESISGLDHVRPEDFPNIDLYMDQVTTFMEKALDSSRRYPEDKILTKTMINNYAKNRLLPSPEKKRYTRDHMLILLFIYYFKNLLSIKDIQDVLSPITEKYFGGSEGQDMTYIYNEVFSMEKGQIEHLRESLLHDFEIAQTTFADEEGEAQLLLRRFALICVLSYDVYIKKTLVEKLIDTVWTGEEEKRPGKDKKSAAKAADGEKKAKAK